MFVVLFEVHPRAERWDDYLGYAKLLRPDLEAIDGFIDNERFASKRRQGWLLSLSTWRDEKALIRWRTFARHHDIQQKGRSEVFHDYRLRVGEVTSDTHIPPGQSLRQQRFDETEVSEAKHVSVVEQRGEPPRLHEGAAGPVEQDLFESILNPGTFLTLMSWAGEPRRDIARAPDSRMREVRIIRDYGLFARAEAPQYFPPEPSRTGGA